MADMAKRACDVAERLQSRRGTDYGQDKQCPCLVASNMPAGDRIQSEARAQAEAAAFVKAATAAGLLNLKGHRLVGGMRASIYNAMPVEGVKKLVEVMKAFEKENA